MKTLHKNQFSQTKKFCRVRLSRLIVTVTVLCFSIVTLLPTGQFVCAAEAVQDAAATARKLQLDGTRLQLQGNLEEAVKKYQESTSYHPNPKLDTLVEKLENQIGKTKQATVDAIAPAKQDAAIATEEQPVTPEQGQVVKSVQETSIQIVAQEEESTRQIEQQAVIKRAPGTPEEELIYAFTDWMLRFFPDMSPSTDFGLETNRNYSITSAGEQFEVRLDPFIFYINKTDGFDFSPLVFNFQPQGNDKLAVQMKMPDKVLSVTDDKSVDAEMIIGSQNISGVWDRTLQNFEQSDLKLGDITIQDIEKKGHLDIKELQLGNLFTRNEQGIWEEQYQGNINGLSFVANEDNFTIQNIAIQSSQDGSNFSRYIELRNNILSISDDLKNMELADTKDFFSSLDEYIQIFNSSASKIVIQGITVHVDGDMSMDSIEISGGLQKDVQTNNFVFNSNGEAKGFSFTDEGGQENMQPVSVSVDHVGFTNNAEINQIPTNLFADLFTTIEGAEKVEEQEADAYLANHGMDFIKELLGLIKGYSSEINLNGLNVVNVMPNPVTLDVAKIGTSFNAGSGAGGRVNALINFFGFNCMDQGANNIPQSANLNLELKNIPSLLNLISDPSSLVEGDMDQVQGQVMMNGMNTFMTSALALSMTDSFIAFPASRFNLDFMANVDNTAKFLSTGNLKIAIENPDDFMRIIQSFGADPEMQRMLATITALANRTAENGKVVDSIDARINQEGKILINTKDVTNMFFPAVTQDVVQGIDSTPPTQAAVQPAEPTIQEGGESPAEPEVHEVGDIIN